MSKFIRCKKCKMKNCPMKDTTKDRVYCQYYTKERKDFRRVS